MTKPRDKGEMASLSSLSDDKGFSGSQSGTSSLFETRGYSSFQTRYTSENGSTNGTSARRSSYTLDDVRDYVEQLKIYVQEEYKHGVIFPDSPSKNDILRTITEYLDDIEMAVSGESMENYVQMTPESPLISKDSGTGSRDILLEFRAWVAQGTKEARKKFFFRRDG